MLRQSLSSQMIDGVFPTKAREIKLFKMTKPYTKYQVKYEPEASNPKEHCSICKHYMYKTTCDIVQGKINPEGWCNKFEKDK